MADIKQAISLINQGKKREAQSILTELIRSNPQEITAWFWYVETLDSLEKRIQLLETCLKQNPGNPQVTKALEMLRAKRSPDKSFYNPPSNSSSQFNETGKATRTVYDDESTTENSSYHNFDDYEGKTKYTDPRTPDIDIQANQKAIAFLNSKNPNREMILPFEYRLVATDHPHVSDMIDHFMRQTSNLPPECRYVIYGYPAVIHPQTGIIFGFLQYTDIYYRLPEKTANKIRAHFDKVFSRKKIRENNRNDSVPVSSLLESNWVADGSYVTDKLIRKCYEYNGGLQQEKATFEFNVDEDLVKVSLPTFFDKLLERFFLLLILAGGFLIVWLILYVLNNFETIIRDVTNLFSGR
jgi:hypothetical protein